MIMKSIHSLKKQRLLRSPPRRILLSLLIAALVPRVAAMQLSHEQDEPSFSADKISDHSGATKPETSVEAFDEYDKKVDGPDGLFDKFGNTYEAGPEGVKNFERALEAFQKENPEYDGDLNLDLFKRGPYQDKFGYLVLVNDDDQTIRAMLAYGTAFDEKDESYFQIIHRVILPWSCDGDLERMAHSARDLLGELVKKLQSICKDPDNFSDPMPIKLEDEVGTEAELKFWEALDFVRHGKEEDFVDFADPDADYQSIKWSPEFPSPKERRRRRRRCL